MVKKALAYLRMIDQWVINQQVELTSIPAPPFGEDARGRRMAELFREVGLKGVETDAEGNVLGMFLENPNDGPGQEGDARPLILSAHLDTVFPEGTDVSPRKDGERILAPGICDDGRGLAALLALARVLREVAPSLPSPILFVATVGEEGPGDLRGVRHLLSEFPEGEHPKAFVSLDGVGMDRIIHRGVGSTRLRITLRGPGGHSWTDFGRENPIHVLGRVVTKAQELDLPSNPKTTLTVARCGGGTSINAIPEEAWIEVDLRSEASPGLRDVEERLRVILDTEVAAKPGERAGSSDVGLEVRDIGRRPAGITPQNEPLVMAAVQASRALGVEPKLIGSSTDSNTAMSMGIPAITIGAGGTGGGIHTLGEWFENTKGPEGILRAFLTVLLFFDVP
jgi:acetylornithine deacetylase/succinyl-diaminopimelate desuccinylase-like protein